MSKLKNKFSHQKWYFYQIKKKPLKSQKKIIKRCKKVT